MGTEGDLPAPLPNDSEDVVFALSTAAVVFRRGDLDDARKWVRRAVDAAQASGDAARAEALESALDGLDRSPSTKYFSEAPGRPTITLDAEAARSLMQRSVSGRPELIRDDFDEHTPAGALAYEARVKASSDVPPMSATPALRPCQAVRAILYRTADGIRIAPAGTSVSAISAEVMLVALDPETDLKAWL